MAESLYANKIEPFASLLELFQSILLPPAPPPAPPNGSKLSFCHIEAVSAFLVVSQI